MLGIDPGTVVLGWGAVEEVGREVRCIASGVIRARGELPLRLAHIYSRLEELLAAYTPGAVSLEKAFVAANVQSALRLGEARGAALAAAAQAGVPVYEYSPAEIKLALVGYGRAEKEQMQAMTARLLALDQVPLPDEADALAAAICHVHSHRMQRHVGGKRNSRRRAPQRPEALLRLRASRRGRA